MECLLPVSAAEIAFNSREAFLFTYPYSAPLLWLFLMWRPPYCFIHPQHPGSFWFSLRIGWTIRPHFPRAFPILTWKAPHLRNLPQPRLTVGYPVEESYPYQSKPKIPQTPNPISSINCIKTWVWVVLMMRVLWSWQRVWILFKKTEGLKHQWCWVIYCYMANFWNLVLQLSEVLWVKNSGIIWLNNSGLSLPQGATVRCQPSFAGFTGQNYLLPKCLTHMASDWCWLLENPQFSSMWASP